MGLGEGIRFVTLDGHKLGAVQEIGLEPSAGPRIPYVISLSRSTL